MQILFGDNSTNIRRTISPNKKEDNIKEKENKKNKNKRYIQIPSAQICHKFKKLTEKRNKTIDKFLKEFTEEQFEQICQIANSSEFLYRTK